MKISVITTKLFLLIILLLARCAEDSKSPTGIETFDLKTVEKRLIQADNKFGLSLFRKIVESERDKNVFISPLSVSMALGMTLNGANSETRETMIETLALNGLTMEEINNSYKNLIDFLYTLDPKVDLQIANSIWYRLGLTFEQEFIDLNKTYFDAEVRGLDFSAADAADIINQWVEDHTNDRIHEMVRKPISPNTVMFLLNAIYFKGAWKYQFAENDTHEDLFTLSDGSSVSCQMMMQKSQFAYTSNTEFQAIELFYGAGDYSMIIFLPHPGVDVNALVAEFTDENLHNWINTFSEDSVLLSLPRFGLDYEIKLNDVLSAMGMGLAFTGAADFTKMYTPGGLYISEVKHKSFVEVNEEGTEAAASTVVVIDRSAASSVINMRVDRPFLFVIRETRSQSILFIGKVEKM